MVPRNSVLVGISLVDGFRSAKAYVDLACTYYFEVLGHSDREK